MRYLLARKVGYKNKERGKRCPDCLHCRILMHDTGRNFRYCVKIQSSPCVSAICGCDLLENTITKGDKNG